MENSEVKKEETDNQGEGSKQEAATTVDPNLVDMVEKAKKIPMPSKDDYWNVQVDLKTQKYKKVLGIFKKKDISLQDVNQLRKSAIQSPGNTRVIVNKLIKKHPQDSTLLMISAICTHGMLMNSSNQKEMVPGLKSAVKECIRALMNDGISVYNCENFLRIYFTMIDRLKRLQIKTYNVIMHDPHLEQSKNIITHAMRISDLLCADKSKSMNVIAHLKKKLKTTTFYTANISFVDINNAVRLVEQGRSKEKCGIALAEELIAYIYALLIAFARIPILATFVSQILNLFSSTNRALFLRKVSVRSACNLTLFKIAVIESQPKQMQKLGQIILKENMVAVKKLEGHPLHQIFETDPFFNIAIIAELTYGLFKRDDQLKILTTAIQAVENVIKHDMTKNHIFTESAKTHTHRLMALKEDIAGKSDDDTGKKTVSADTSPK